MTEESFNCRHRNKLDLVLEWRPKLREMYHINDTNAKKVTTLNTKLGGTEHSEIAKLLDNFHMMVREMIVFFHRYLSTEELVKYTLLPTIVRASGLKEDMPDEVFLCRECAVERIMSINHRLPIDWEIIIRREGLEQ